ncbi:hypothetical protein BKA80DRAFT_295357 [Phyllosticta citrichinensis]
MEFPLKAELLKGELGADYVEPKADKILWVLQQDPFVIRFLLQHQLLPSLIEDVALQDAIEFRTAHGFSASVYKCAARTGDGFDLRNAEDTMFAMDPRLLLGLCVRDLIRVTLNFKNNPRIADWLGLTCPPSILPRSFSGRLAYEEHSSLDWMKFNSCWSERKQY